MWIIHLHRICCALIKPWQHPGLGIKTLWNVQQWREQRKTPEIIKHKWEDDDNGRRVLKESYRVTRRPPQYLQGYYWPGRLGMAPGHYRALFTGLQGAWNKMQEKKFHQKEKGNSVNAVCAENLPVFPPTLQIYTPKRWTLIPGENN